MKHCAAAQKIRENSDRIVAGSVISRSNPAITIFMKNRYFGHARPDFHENPWNFHWNLLKHIKNMCPILIFTHATIKTMKNQPLVGSTKNSWKSTSLKTRWTRGTLHQDHFRNSSLQKNNPYAYVLAQKLCTVAVHNRLYEKNPFYGAPAM